MFDMLRLRGHANVVQGLAETKTVARADRMARARTWSSPATKDQQKLTFFVDSTWAFSYRVDHRHGAFPTPFSTHQTYRQGEGFRSPLGGKQAFVSCRSPNPQDS